MEKGRDGTRRKVETPEGNSRRSQSEKHEQRVSDRERETGAGRQAGELEVAKRRADRG